MIASAAISEATATGAREYPAQALIKHVSATNAVAKERTYGSAANPSRFALASFVKTRIPRSLLIFHLMDQSVMVQGN
jgi:hypothetical protein